MIGVMCPPTKIPSARVSEEKTQSQKGRCAKEKTAGIIDSPPLVNSTLEN